MDWNFSCCLLFMENWNCLAIRTVKKTGPAEKTEERQGPKKEVLKNELSFTS